MKVGLLTSWDERCGIAEYGKSLVSSLVGRGIEFEIYARDRWDAQTIVNGDFDVLHLNYEAGLLGWFSEADVRTAASKGKHTVLTLHSSQATNRRPFTEAFNRVVLHEKTGERFDYIPEGIVDDMADASIGSSNALGTAGFPFWHKGFPEVAQAARILERDCLVIAPESGHVDTHAMEEHILRIKPDTIYIKDYMPLRDVIQKLRDDAAVMVFPYQGQPTGISGAVRMGIATGKPVVITRNGQFKDLYDYEDEIEIAESHEAGHIAAAVTRVLANGKRPKRLLQDMGWSHVSSMYESLYKEVHQCG